MSDIGHRLVKRLNNRMKQLNCPVTFSEVETKKERQVLVRGSFTRGQEELAALMPCPTTVAHFPETIDSIAEGFFYDYRRKISTQEVSLNV